MPELDETTWTKSGFPTDQKVGGSNPFGRATFVQVKGLEAKAASALRPLCVTSVSHRSQKRAAQVVTLGRSQGRLRARVRSLARAYGF